MIFRNLIFEPEVVKQRLRAGMVSHHEQQASKCNGEKQHRVLWPAYNLNIAPPQASTEGLFQQTRLLTTVIYQNCRMSVSNSDMSQSAAAALGLVLLSNLAAAGTVPKLPRSITGVVEVTNAQKQPTKIVKPVYPPAARQAWIQGMVSLDVVVGKTGSVEMLGCDDYCSMLPQILIESAA